MINGTLCYLCRWYMHINYKECSVIHLHLDLGTIIGYIHLFQRIRCLTSIKGLAHSRNQHIRYKVIYFTARFIIRIKSWIVFLHRTNQSDLTYRYLSWSGHLDINSVCYILNGAQTWSVKYFSKCANMLYPCPPVVKYQQNDTIHFRNS